VTEKISALRTEIYFHERAACARQDEAPVEGMMNSEPLELS